VTGPAEARIGLGRDVGIVGLDEVRQGVCPEAHAGGLGLVGAGLESGDAAGEELGIGFVVAPALEGVRVVQAHQVGPRHVAQHLIDGGLREIGDEVRASPFRGHLGP
ncbi:MAG: hypothetical protein ACK55I_04430, partial [bacterium]